MNFESDFRFQFYGSADSIDKDVAIILHELPELQEDRKRLVTTIKTVYNLPNYNIMLISVKNGVVSDCMVPAPLCGLNNSLFTTYGSFEQIHPNAIIQKIDRNIPLACFRAMYFVMSCLCRTHYRTLIRPLMHFRVPFEKKLDALLQVDFNSINSFNQKNMTDIDIWKKLAFYLVQYVALTRGKEIYNKTDACNYTEKSIPFIRRMPLVETDKEWLTIMLQYIIHELNMNGYIHSDTNLHISNQIADMRKGRAIIT